MTPDWQTADGSVQLYRADCLEVLPTLTGVDCVLTDPPYGISYNREDEPQAKHIFSHGRQLSAVAGDDMPFDPTILMRFKSLILWGANCYASRLPDEPTWLVWDKVTRNGLNLRIAECEMAWTNCVGRSRVFRHLWSGAYRDSERDCYAHPTQKPIALMEWCIELVRPMPTTILDPFMGSGTTGVACVRLGRRFIGVEKEPKYFEIAVRRIEAELNRAPLFEEPPVIQKQLVEV